jgi:dihydroorotate dehydrogenase (NAD+) catalytic subunit
VADPVSLATTVAGIEFPTPVLVASGTFGSGVELSRLLDLRKIGGIVTKSVTPQPVRGLPTPRMVETPSGMLNAIGLQNPGVEAFVEKDGPFIARAGVPVIVSIAGKSVQEYAEVAIRVSKVPGVMGLEVNISCPNVERRNEVFACDPQAAGEVIGTVTRMTHLPVFAKLTADVTDLVEVAQSCVRAGAHGLSLINTLLGMAIDVEAFRPKLGGVTGGLSGPAIRPLAVRCVFQVARALPETPILGIGGITDTDGAVEFLLAGAALVQVGTAIFFDPHAPIDIAEGIGAFLARRGMSSPMDLRGRVVTPAPAAEPAYRGG